MPKIDQTISLGNLLSVIGTLLTALGMAGALFLWGGKISERAENIDREILHIQSDLSSHEARIRAVEQMSARQDERLTLILDSLRKIEAKIEGRQ